MNRYLTAYLCAAAVLCLSLLTPAQAGMIGQVKNVVPSTIWVSPDGEHVISVTVDMKRPGQKRRVNLDGVLQPGWFDSIAEGTPFFSPDGKHYAFVGVRGTNCMVVLDGEEQQSYPITATNRLPITGVVFGSDGPRTHLAYQATEKGKHYVVVNGQRMGGYESIDKERGLPGIWDFQFIGNSFLYRHKHGGGQRAVLGRIDERQRNYVTSSKSYNSMRAETPVPMGGKPHKDYGEYIAFVGEKAPGQLQVFKLPGDTPIDSKMWKEIPGGILQASPANNGEMAYIAGNTNWVVVVGGKEWPGCYTTGKLMSSPSGKTWACTAIMKKGKNIVMMVNGVPGKEYAEIQTGKTLFPAGDERVIFGAATRGGSKTPAHIVVDGKEGKAYTQVRGDSVVFSSDKKAMAYVAGDGIKDFVVLNGVEGEAFDEVHDVLFAPSRRVMAYRARRGVEHFVVVGKKAMGPYVNVKPGSLTFRDDGKVVAWSAFGKDGLWHVYANGKPIDAGCERVISRLTFVPGMAQPAYVGQFVAEGKTFYSMSYGGKLGRAFDSIWLGDGGKLFVQEDGTIPYFGKSGSLLYRVVAKKK
ncbi:MAG: hypothetical protein OSB41_05025 [Kiritimatiellae bacterium]|nr:hypothetical protein [Kiritimatiellia bacterium]